MKFIFLKIAHGFLFGIGLSLVLGIAFYYMTIQTQQLMDESYSAIYNPEPGSIEITKHRKLERNGALIILGEITNTGEEDNDNVRVSVDLYQGEDFVKQCNTYISGTLAAEESRNFEMQCGGGCSKSSIVEHDSYKIYITGI